VALAPDQVAENFTAVARTPEALEADKAREIALSEAYSRATHLQDELAKREQMLSTLQAELESLKSELLTSNAARHELDNRLVRAREDVASELAVLASTMIKMKDDALARAEARIAALTATLNDLRADVAPSPAPELPRTEAATPAAGQAPTTVEESAERASEADDESSDAAPTNATPASAA
jgi:predicted RNase H-like nuclease (RuvC/YqgF family)